MSRWLGSWQGIGAVWVFCAVWLGAGFSVDTLTLALSIVALTFTQLVLMEQVRDVARQDRMLREVVHATEGADDRACED